ncbi:MAG: tetratricopeptide repeat protein [Planctomycetaceae bacterium]|nr:tetratricopeptide repeat protein [Planctomycetaceae bacterium]
MSGCSQLTADGRNSQGVKYYQQSRYDLALSEFQTAANQNPSDANSYYNIASTYHKLGMTNNDASYYGQAEQYYRLCLTKDPNHVNCHRGLAVLMIETGRIQEAFQMMRDWELSIPGSPEPKIELARLYQELGHPQEAVSYLTAAVASDPKNERAYNALAYSREQSGDLAQALANYQVSYQINPYQPEIAAKITQLGGTIPTATNMVAHTNIATNNALAANGVATQSVVPPSLAPTPNLDTPTRIASRNRFGAGM